MLLSDRQVYRIPTGIEGVYCIFFGVTLPKTNPLPVERKTLVTCTHSLRCASYCTYPYSTRQEVRVSESVFFNFFTKVRPRPKSCNRRQTHSVFSHFNAGPPLTFALNAGVTMRCRAEIFGGSTCGDVTELLIVLVNLKSRVWTEYVYTINNNIYVRKDYCYHYYYMFFFFFGVSYICIAIGQIIMYGVSYV